MLRWIASMVTTVAVVMVSCKKEYKQPSYPTPPPVEGQKKILLRDITIPRLPSPYYHFEYNADSTISKASFSSDFTRYDVFYDGEKISEMRNNIIVNHDTLRYIYDNTGKVGMIIFINDANVIYRNVIFGYDGQQLKQIIWDHVEGNAGFMVDRTLTFIYFPDGNVKEIKEHRPTIGSQAEVNFSTHFDQYDDKINVDDFSLWHDGIHDHLFLLPGVHIQKNNPRKEMHTGDGDNYTIDYTYTYNNDGTPLLKSGSLLFTTGQLTGQRFQLSTSYSYY